MDDDGGVELLDMGRPLGILDLARRVARRHGLEPIDEGTPDRPGAVRLVVTGPRPGEKLHEDLTDHDETPRPSSHPRIQRRGGPRPAAGVVDRTIADLTARIAGPPEALTAALLAAVTAGDDRRPR